jgi:hypothetical protein
VEPKKKKTNTYDTFYPILTLSDSHEIHGVDGIWHHNNNRNEENRSRALDGPYLGKIWLFLNFPFTHSWTGRFILPTPVRQYFLSHQSTLVHAFAGMHELQHNGMRAARNGNGTPRVEQQRQSYNIHRFQSPPKQNAWSLPQPTRAPIGLQ